MYCNMSIVLSAQADKPNRNGVTYTEECLRKAFTPEKLAGLPVTIAGKVIGYTDTKLGEIRTVFKDGRVDATIPVKFFCGATGTCEQVLMDEKTVVSATVTEISIGLEDEA